MPYSLGKKGTINKINVMITQTVIQLTTRLAEHDV